TRSRRASRMSVSCFRPFGARRAWEASRSARTPSATVSSARWDSGLLSGLELDLVILDHRIREQLIPHPLRGRARGILVGGGERDHDLFAGAHFGGVVAERAKGGQHGFALWIAHLVLRPYEHSGDKSHESAFPTSRR